MKNRTLTLQRVNNGAACQTLNVSVAETFFARLKGLLGKSGLNPGEGLLITPCSGIHTIGMRFPIDVVFLDANQAVAGVAENVKPMAFRNGPKATKAVLELAAGGIRQLGISVGETLIFD